MVRDFEQVGSGTSGSTKPYLIRAIYDWAVDSQFTPHLLVSAMTDQVVVPNAYVRDGQIVLNVHPHSVRDLELGNEFISFSARFSGQSFDIIVPIFAVIAVYAKESGQGIAFAEQHDPSPTPSPRPPADSKQPNSEKGKTSMGSHLKLVK